ncbi:MAG: DUF1848 domain-containing protein [bacterium]|nr:DUF1848 domain-containing protein [bacterium]
MPRHYPLPSGPRIISASRRCDIPATHATWFLRSLRAGRASFTHPFSHQRLTVSLAPPDVIGFVFWSKDFSSFHDVLAEVRDRGFLFYCLYTITGLPEPFEHHQSPLDHRIRDFQKLAETFGPACVIWRFDPIVLSPHISQKDTVARFSTIARLLSRCTRDCIVSFVQQYPHVLRRLSQRHIDLIDPPLDTKRALLRQLAAIARFHAISLQVCCQDELVGGLVKKAHCVDIWRFRELAATTLPNVPRRPTRPTCGCSLSIDIGSYHACPHACLYCYARPHNSNPH